MSKLATCPWLVSLPLTRPKETRTRLFVFPHAGGHPALYSAWKFEDVSVFHLLYPGRGKRREEAPCTSVTGLVDAIIASVGPLFGEDGIPFCFAGHSLGALVAYEVATRLGSKGMATPRHVFVSGMVAPHAFSARRQERKFGEMTEEEFVEHLRRLGGTPEEVISNKELLRWFLPPLRVDFAMADDYHCRPPPHLLSDTTSNCGSGGNSEGEGEDGEGKAVSSTGLPCPVTASFGADDALTPAAGMCLWVHHAPGARAGCDTKVTVLSDHSDASLAAPFPACSVRRFPGGHFFPAERSDYLAFLGKALGKIATVQAEAGGRSEG